MLPGMAQGNAFDDDLDENQDDDDDDIGVSVEQQTIDEIHMGSQIRNSPVYGQAVQNNLWVKQDLVKKAAPTFAASLGLEARMYDYVFCQREHKGSTRSPFIAGRTPEEEQPLRV